MVATKIKEAGQTGVNEKKKCGIIMPIAETLGYAQGHWKDVYKILSEAIDKTEFASQLVSDDDAIGLIHDRIVTNIYNNDIVICDVSSKNPNVMFELGMRLAFDKPTIIIKDEKTDYSFDTGVIEHLQYPSSLRFHDIKEFQTTLTEHLKATYERSQTESDYSPFLKSFGRTLKASSIKPNEITEGNYILDELAKINRELLALRKLYTASPNLHYDDIIKISSDKYDRQCLDEVNKIFKFIQLSNGKDSETVK